MCTPVRGNENPPAALSLLHTVKSVGNVQLADNGQMGAGGDYHRRVHERHDGSDLMSELRYAARLKMDRRV